MKEIDLNTWKRRQHFEFFKRVDLPFYNVNAQVDVTGVREFAKAHQLSLNAVLMYLTVSAMNNVENLRLRLRGDSVVLHEKLTPCFAHIKPGDDLFAMVVAEFSSDIVEFDRLVRAAISASHTYFDRQQLVGRDDVLFISAMPWIAFTGVDHTLGLNRNDAIPRVTWGKLIVDGSCVKLPYNIQVNHMFVDGIHVGRFFEQLEQEVHQLLSAGGTVAQRTGP